MLRSMVSAHETFCEIDLAKFFLAVAEKQVPSSS